MRLADALLVTAAMTVLSLTVAGLAGTQAAIAIDRQMDAIRQVSTTLDDALKGN